MATAQPGDILVAATDGFTATAITGDLLVGMANNRGIRGLVTDGLVRDLAGILAVGLPVYCAGITAQLAGAQRPRHGRPAGGAGRRHRRIPATS